MDIQDIGTWAGGAVLALSLALLNYANSFALPSGYDAKLLKRAKADETQNAARKRLQRIEPSIGLCQKWSGEIELQTKTDAKIEFPEDMFLGCYGAVFGDEPMALGRDSFSFELHPDGLALSSMSPSMLSFPQPIGGGDADKIERFTSCLESTAGNWKLNQAARRCRVIKGKVSFVQYKI
jgi:hypothetical protein